MSQDNRKAVETMTTRIHKAAKQNGGTLTREQARKISVASVKRNERDKR